MIWASILIILGLLLLVWSSDRFIDGATAVAAELGMPPLLIGMIIVGFGTSVPEMLVSIMAALQGSPGIALGNAYGSNITNIGLILGLTAILSPIAVQSKVLVKELPFLAAVTGLTVFLLWDGQLARLDALILLGVFGSFLFWSLRQGRVLPADNLATEVAVELTGKTLSTGKAWFWLLLGLLVLITSSRMLVWGAVTIARGFGVSDLLIGLTVVAIGTSLPELASSLMAIRKGEHDIALGNVIGSNLFNTLAVVGLAGVIQPMAIAREVLFRDLLVMGLLTLAVFLVGYRFRGSGRINRLEGAALLFAYLLYTVWLIRSA